MLIDKRSHLISNSSLYLCGVNVRMKCHVGTHVGTHVVNFLGASHVESLVGNDVENYFDSFCKCEWFRVAQSIWQFETSLPT